MKLHSSPVSPNGKRVRICASELSVRLEQIPVDFQTGQNRSPEYLARNPMGKIPTLEDGDFVLWESAAILCYLAHSSGGALWPKDARVEADLLRWLFFCSCHIDPYFTTLVVERFIKARQSLPPDDAATAAAERWLSRFVPILEGQLSGREFVTGAFSLADIALGCTLELSPRLQFDLGPYPNVRGWLERLQARKSWREASA